VIIQSNATIGIGVAPVSFVWPPAHRASRFLDPAMARTLPSMAARVCPNVH
jgi:hypothetical protein